jgi:putative ABC transport system ATP-binding protein
MGVLVEAKNIVKRFQVGEVVNTVLHGISFTIEEGELDVILGPSGSGKSTMVNIIGGIDTLSEGELYYKGQALHKLNRSGLTQYRRDHIGFIFQFYNLMPNLTAYENIELAAQLSADPLDPEELLEKVGLKGKGDNYPSRMSGGQQQRVAIARAVCKNPDLLLCDEPTGALDIRTGAEILKVLSGFNKEYRKTVFIITHNADIAQIADRVFYFRDGLIEKIVKNERPLSVDEVQW